MLGSSASASPLFQVGLLNWRVGVLNKSLMSNIIWKEWILYIYSWSMMHVSQGIGILCARNV